MQKIRRIAAVGCLLCWMALCLLTASAAGEQPVWASIQGTDLYVYLPAQDAVTQVQVGNTACTSFQSTPVAELDTPVETVVLLDNSISISQEDRPLIQQILNNLIGNRLPGEVFTIATMDTEIHYLSQKEGNYLTLQGLIEGIQHNDQDTRLTDGLYQLLDDLQALPAQVEMLLNNQENIQRFANRYLAAKDVFFIGRGVDQAISMEGSLKLKEISYIHSEAYAAGELKHGTISLIEEGTLVVAVLTQENLYKKMISNMVEVRTRGAFVMAVTVEGNTEVEKAADYVIYIPETNKYFTNSLAIIPLQLFGYYIALGRGCDVDKPRNLAKSVTVE